ncbi:MAG: three-Cys-motif partner protein TcmP [Phascolarctobacterium sp.]|nr:three-Cys-motif partner protein TcmP [Phascolarctobacterium sp.]
MANKNSQIFGGDWTEKKLNIFEKYLRAYIMALKEQNFSKVYIDAFAGTGTIYTKDGKLLDGSARIALSSSPKFDKYFFVEQDYHKYLELKKMIREEFPELEHKVVCLRGDANELLNYIINRVNWGSSRGLLFIDPYATQFDWSTLVNVSKTYAIDVWYLFPFSALNRMLTRDGEIVESWRKKIDSVLGCSDWYDFFYKPDPQISLFDEEKEQYIKDVDTNELKGYIIERLETIFPAVSKNPRVFYNSTNSPLFLLCFAVSNKSKKAIDLAMRIASDILSR